MSLFADMIRPLLITHTLPPTYLSILHNTTQHNKRYRYISFRRFVHTTGVFPPGHEGVEKYLNRPDVKTAIHATATPQPYVECADPPFLALSHQGDDNVSLSLSSNLCLFLLSNIPIRTLPIAVPLSSS